MEKALNNLQYDKQSAVITWILGPSCLVIVVLFYYVMLYISIE